MLTVYSYFQFGFSRTESSLLHYFWSAKKFGASAAVRDHEEINC